jgi:hypothetical protein
LDVAPDVVEKVPEAHKIGLCDAKGQKDPGGQSTGAPLEQ